MHLTHFASAPLQEITTSGNRYLQIHIFPDQNFRRVSRRCYFHRRKKRVPEPKAGRPDRFNLYPLFPPFKNTGWENFIYYVKSYRWAPCVTGRLRKEGSFFFSMGKRQELPLIWEGKGPRFIYKGCETERRDKFVSF